MKKNCYKKITRNISNLRLLMIRFVQEAIQAIAQELPAILRWAVDSEEEIDDGWLIIRRGERRLFVFNLKEKEGEFMMIPSGAPYAFTLRKGEEEEEVHIIEDLFETEIPLVLESARLGIRVILDCERL